MKMYEVSFPMLTCWCCFVCR